ncbi:hypothetical protein LEP1GSC170_1852 [Leptospira interrogans serovar Bataviae str. HAI135]|nr:hypothetical protein LEP1GSC170_1852 [Leptospira interrogans serovar Bataviae str. HAI135]
MRTYYSELYNRVSKILLQNGDWIQNECPPILVEMSKTIRVV